ncbi:MAG: pyridoxal-dependent decarboxylase [Proteobacteria bacterium]|nr:pyridoxal-dependent decarboxylase [Pseudomonadota bacterium]
MNQSSGTSNIHPDNHPDVRANFHLDPQSLRAAVLGAVDVLETHLSQIENTPVKPHIEPGTVAAKFAEHAPDQPSDIATLLNIFQNNLLPAVTLWQHPRFFAYYPAATSIPAIVSELLIASLGSVGLQWSANPAATELECVIMDWLLDLLHAPKESSFRHKVLAGFFLTRSLHVRPESFLRSQSRPHRRHETTQDSRAKTCRR